MKKKVIIIILIVIILLLSLIGMRIIFSKDSFRFKWSYEYVNYMEYSNGKRIQVSIPLQNRVKYLSNAELLEFLENGTGILYFGYNTCPWCRNIVPILIDTILKNQIDTLYYVDVHEDLSDIQDELYEYLDSYLSTNEEGEKGLAVPDVYFIQKGKVVGHHLGTVDSYRDPYLGMTEEQKQELSNIYQNLYEEMKS